MSETGKASVFSASRIFIAIAFALFLLAAFGVRSGVADLTDLGLASLALGVLL